MYSTTQRRRPRPSPHGCQRLPTPAAAIALAAEEPAGYTTAVQPGGSSVTTTATIATLAAEEPAGYTTAGDGAGDPGSTTDGGAGAGAAAGFGGALSLAGLLE
ncbi:MAG: hypothetical protein R6T85_07050, partial [Egibacteraceae bacterium]